MNDDRGQAVQDQTTTKKREQYEKRKIEKQTKNDFSRKCKIFLLIVIRMEKKGFLFSRK